MKISNKTDYSALFHSLPTAKNGSAGVSTSFLSDYASIKNGSYGKLMKAYYGGSKTASELTSGYTGSKDSAATITKIQSATEDLKAVANDLRKDTSLYKEGNEEDLVKKVSEFVKDYNSVADKTLDSDNVKILRAADNMVKNTSMNANILSRVGITINEDNTLSLNEETLKSANKETVKSVFGSSSGVAYQSAVSAANINIYAASDARKASGMYGSDASYTASTSTGSLYNSIY